MQSYNYYIHTSYVPTENLKEVTRHHSHIDFVCKVLFKVPHSQIQQPFLPSLSLSPLLLSFFFHRRSPQLSLIILGHKLDTHIYTCTCTWYIELKFIGDFELGGKIPKFGIEMNGVYINSPIYVPPPTYSGDIIKSNVNTCTYMYMYMYIYTYTNM